MMELLNAVGRLGGSTPQDRAVRQEALEIAALVLSPIIPHVCHALWRDLGHATAIIDEPWPAVDQAALLRDAVEIVVQVNGKLRARLSVPAGASEELARTAALADEHVQRFVADKPLRKVIYVPDKLLNLVV